MLSGNELQTAFLTDVIQPWNEMISMLSFPWALHREKSKATRLAGSLAIAVRHLPEQVGIKQKMVHDECSANVKIYDVADAYKHAKLDKPERMNNLFVATYFEFNEQSRCRFLYSKLLVNHATHGEFDFMRVSAEAIEYWLGKLQLPIKWRSIFPVGTDDFHEIAKLHHNVDNSALVYELNIRWLTKDSGGTLVSADPPYVEFCLLKDPRIPV